MRNLEVGISRKALYGDAAGVLARVGVAVLLCLFAALDASADWRIQSADDVAKACGRTGTEVDALMDRGYCRGAVEGVYYSILMLDEYEATGDVTAEMLRASFLRNVDKVADGKSNRLRSAVYVMQFGWIDDGFLRKVSK